MTADQIKALAVYQKYDKGYDGDIQGCCPLIADEIQKAIGGEVVAGYLLFGGCRRSHWWVAKEDIVFDPMGDAILCREEWGVREEAHRSRDVFLAVLPRYEQYRLPSEAV